MDLTGFKRFMGSLTFEVVWEGRSRHPVKLNYFPSRSVSRGQDEASLSV